MGLMAVRFGELMREPVTMTSSSPEVAGVVATAACCAQAAGTTAVAVAAASAARTANCNLRLIPIGWSLTYKVLKIDKTPSAFCRDARIKPRGLVVANPPQRNISVRRELFT